MSSVREVKSNLLFRLKSNFPGAYTVTFGLKKLLASTLKRESESSALPYRRLKIAEFKNTFFGYYDISPFHPTNEQWLVFLANNQNPYFKPSRKNASAIILYDLEREEYRILGETRAWNWQQGSRAQWLTDKQIIYNDYAPADNKLVTKILNIDSGDIRVIEEPFQVIFRNEYFLTIDYQALFAMKSEYAYPYPAPNSKIRDGIFRHDFATATFEKIVDIPEIRQALRLPAMAERKSEHINHLLISPEGTHMIFIYRFSDHKRHDFLMAYDMNTGSLQVLVKDELISHCAWRNNDTLLFWGVIGGERGYFTYTLPTHQLDLAWKSIRDGHPGFINNNQFITDTYPDKYSLQQLKKIDLEYGKEELLASVYHPPFFELQTRCDLHPSISPSGKFIQVDAITYRRREIMLFEHE